MEKITTFKRYPKGLTEFQRINDETAYFMDRTINGWNNYRKITSYGFTGLTFAMQPELITTACCQSILPSCEDFQF